MLRNVEEYWGMWGNMVKLEEFLTLSDKEQQQQQQQQRT